MKTIYIQFVYKSIKKKKKIENDLLWYDSQENDLSKRLKKYRGGRLEVKYDFKNKKRYVDVVDQEVNYYEKESNENDIRKWLKSNMNRFDLDINLDHSDDRGIAVDVKNIMLDSVCDALIQRGFHFDTLD